MYNMDKGNILVYTHECVYKKSWHKLVQLLSLNLLINIQKKEKCKIVKQ